MESAIERPRARVGASALAGLQAGMLGACWMLAWLGVAAVWGRRSFWTAANLMATAFYGDRALHNGWAGETPPGIALYLLIYSLLGALFAALVRDRLPRFRVLLASVAWALVWYYVSFHLIWIRTAPLLALLHATRPTILGHLVYGTFLARYPLYSMTAAGPDVPEPPSTPSPEAAEPLPGQGPASVPEAAPPETADR